MNNQLLVEYYLLCEIIASCQLILFVKTARNGHQLVGGNGDGGRNNNNNNNNSRCSSPVKYKCRKLDWSVYTCLTQLYDGRNMYIIYYIKNNYTFRHVTLAIFRLRNEKLSKQLYSNCVYCIQWGGKRWSGYEISHVLYRMGGVGTWVLLFMLFWVNTVGSMVSFYVCRDYMYMYT